MQLLLSSPTKSHSDDIQLELLLCNLTIKEKVNLQHKKLFWGLEQLLFLWFFKVNGIWIYQWDRFLHEYFSLKTPWSQLCKEHHHVNFSFHPDWFSHLEVLESPCYSNMLRKSCPSKCKGSVLLDNKWKPFNFSIKEQMAAIDKRSR